MLFRSPLTMLTYAVEGGGSKDYAHTKALLFGAPLFEGSGFRGIRRVIDVSGDGVNNNGLGMWLNNVGASSDTSVLPSPVPSPQMTPPYSLISRSAAACSAHSVCVPCAEASCSVMRFACAIDTSSGLRSKP